VDHGRCRCRPWSSAPQTVAILAGRLADLSRNCHQFVEFLSGWRPCLAALEGEFQLAGRLCSGIRTGGFRPIIKSGVLVECQNAAYWSLLNSAARLVRAVRPYFQVVLSNPRASCPGQRWGAKILRRVAKVQPVRAMDSIHHREDHQGRLPAKVMANQIDH
jgi:hypothetical protein